MGKEIKAPVPTQEVTPTPIQFKNTTVGKTIRTFFQSTAAVVTLVIPTLMASEEFRTLVSSQPKLSWMLVVFPVAVAVFTAIQNALDPTVPTTTKDI